MAINLLFPCCDSQDGLRNSKKEGGCRSILVHAITALAVALILGTGATLATYFLTKGAIIWSALAGCSTTLVAACAVYVLLRCILGQIVKQVEEPIVSGREEEIPPPVPSTHPEIKRREPLQDLDIEERPSLFTTVSTKQSRWSIDFTDKSFEKTLLNDPEVSDELKLLVKGYSSPKNIKLVKENVTMPNAICPGVNSLKSKVALYQQKYGICTEVCLDTALAGRLKELRESRSQELIGIIVVQQWQQEGHVTPILCDFTQNRNDILSLDVLGNLSEKPGPTIQFACESLNVNLMICAEERQSDEVSCRTDASVVVRNALLHIKWLQSKGLYKGLPEMTQPINPEYKRYVGIPLEWKYTDQITPGILKENGQADATVIRDLFSKKKEKNEHPQTVRAFRDRYRREITLKYTLTLYKSYIKQALPDFSAVKLPSHVTVQETTEAVEITWTKQPAVNTYLMDKAVRNARLVSGS